MIAVDKNGVLRYLLNDDDQQSSRAAALFAGERPVYVSHVVLAKTIWTLQGKKYRLDRRDVVGVVRGLFAESRVVFENARVVWRALDDFRGGPSGRHISADFAYALILSTARAYAEQSLLEFGGLYTFDGKTLRMPGTAAA